MNSIGKYISKNKLRRLLNASKADGGFAFMNISCEDYDFGKPYYFNTKDFENIKAESFRLSEVISKSFSEMCNGDFDVKVTSLKENYLKALIENTAENELLMPILNPKQELVGALKFDLKTAKNWAGQVFGDENEDQEKDEATITEIEQSLINDIAQKLASVFVKFFQLKKCSIPEEVQNDIDEIEGSEFTGCLEYSLAVTKGENKQDNNFNFFILWNIVAESIGKEITENKDISLEKVTAAIRNNFEKMPVEVISDFGNAKMNFQDAMNLDKGDILIMDKKVGDPLDIKLDNRIILKGDPVKCEEKYAVSITEVMNNK